VEEQPTGRHDWSNRLWALLCLETSRAERLFGFKAQTPFAEGLRRTIAWYQVVGQHEKL